MRARIKMRKRIGFIAKEIKESLGEKLPDISNIVVESGDNLVLHYGRLVCILWGALKEITNTK